MATFGKVRQVAAQFYFEWQIDDFFSLPEKDSVRCNSPSFSFAEESWYFGIYPNGGSANIASGYIEVYLNREMDGPPISLAWSLGVKTFEGKTDRVKQFSQHVFEKATGWGKSQFLKRSELFEKKSELVPSDVLTLVCHIEYYSKSKNGAAQPGKTTFFHRELPSYLFIWQPSSLAVRSTYVLVKAMDNIQIFDDFQPSYLKHGNTETAKCSHCKKTFAAEYISSHEQKCLDKPMTCPTCENVVRLREWFDHECDTARVKATEKLLEDWANILDSEEHSDVTIKVKEKEFRLHRSVLAARNSYFNSMFKTEMIEKTTGIVSIDDCEPDIFQSFIYFIYTGKVETLSCDKVCALYEVADKYQEDQLKSECLCYMKNEMSIDSFIDFIVLALKHDEKELLQKATDLYCRKAKEIVQSVKWQTFLREYPTQANELYIKALNFLTSK